MDDNYLKIFLGHLKMIILLIIMVIELMTNYYES